MEASSADTRKSFADLHQAYGFFLAHTTEPRACREAVLGQLAAWDRPAGRPLRWLDFGCGCGEFLEALLAAWGAGPLDLALVDVDTAGLARAADRLARFASRVTTARRVGDLPAGAAYDLIHSNHVLYYVADLDDALAELHRRLAPGGRLILTLGGRGNQLCRLWQEAFAKAGQPVPFYVAEDVSRAIEKAGWRCTTTPVASTLRCRDLPENRALLIDFLFGKWSDQLGADNLTALFDPYACGGEIVMPNVDLQFVLR